MSNAIKGFAVENKVFLKLAYKLAKKGFYTVLPNPSVGCVLVKNGKVIGQGWHQFCGEKHAEILAIEDAENQGYSVVGSTLFVTLEPCNHFGNTPPCCDLIIAKKIKKVVIGIEDCDSRTNGKGIEKLKSAGIEVEVINNKKLIHKIKFLLRYYLKRITKRKPWITLKIANSLDGKIALNNGKSQWITNEQSRKDAHWLRLSADVILTTAKTILNDNPKYTVRIDAKKLSNKIATTKIKQPTLCILDSHLKLNEELNVFKEDREIILFYSSDYLAAKHFSNQYSNIQLSPIPTSKEGLLELSAINQYLSDKGFSHLLVEAGAKLNASFLQSFLVDEIIVYMSSKILGNRAKSAFEMLEQKDIAGEQFMLKSVKKMGNDLKLQYLHQKCLAE